MDTLLSKEYGDGATGQFGGDDPVSLTEGEVGSASSVSPCTPTVTTSW